MTSEKRLIDEFKREVMSEFIRRCNGNDYNKLTLLRIGETIDRIYEKYSTLPTVNAVEVVHGQWINITDFGNGDCYGFCSACASEQHAQNASALKAFHRYCRWCGAKMDGERKDNDI